MPKQSEIKQEELQEFWEGCGFTQNKQNYGRGSEYLWNYPDAQVGTLPSIDLNNLFRYAVPKLSEDVFHIDFVIVPAGYACDIKTLHKQVGYGLDKDPAPALYQAIQNYIQKARRKDK